MDEPTAGIDVTLRKEVLKLLDRMKKHTTILLVTHYLEEIVSECDFVALMICGQIEIFGDLDCLTSLYG